MNAEKLLAEIKDNLNAVISRESALGESLWKTFLDLHPADIADFLSELPREQAPLLFANLPNTLKMDVFEELSDLMKGLVLEGMTDQEKVDAFRSLPADELADLFDHFSDENLKKYLALLQKDVREQVLSLMQFEPDSAGGIMTTDVITLMKDFTVKQAITLLQRVQPNREIHQHIYVVDKEHNLLGHIRLESLVLHKPEERIESFMKSNELVVRADEDQEVVAQEMVHYGLTTAPVVSSTNKFLGVISTEELVDVLVEEATEDVQRMASLPPMKYPYFDIPFFKVLYLRSYVLIALLIAESFSGTLLRHYDYIVKFGILGSFLPMLISAGGNSGSQTSAVVIQGLASGEITVSNMFRLLWREFYVSFLCASILGVISFLRAYFVGGSLMECIAISTSLGIIVLVSSMLGTIIPFILRRFNIDPAFSAGPFLATLMDILGIVIYCRVSDFLLQQIATCS
jgi:magnesium transporter